MLVILIVSISFRFCRNSPDNDCGVHSLAILSNFHPVRLCFPPVHPTNPIIIQTISLLFIKILSESC